jgi:hypothetical protein
MMIQNESIGKLLDWKSERDYLTEVPNRMARLCAHEFTGVFWMLP